MRTTVNLPEPLIAGAKALADQLDVTFSVVVEDAVRAYLARKAEQSVKPVSLHTVRGRLVDPGVDLDRTSALLLHDDWSAFRSKP